MPTEQIRVEVILSGTYWDRAPEYVIELAGQRISDRVTTASDERFTVAFDVELTEDQEYALDVALTNKLNTDTVENADKSGILKDMLLNIHDVRIDGISLGVMMWTHSEYHVERFPEPIFNCVNLGWNGVWRLRFTSPFYIWYLENN